VICLLLAAIAADHVIAVWFGLLRPARALLRAAAAVAAGTTTPVFRRQARPSWLTWAAASS